jgi:long-chain acyl-CoA synthetase
LVKRDGRYGAVTWAETSQAVHETAAGLIALGVAPGDRVAILSATRREWLETDFAALAAGCVTIPIYPSNLPFECGFIIHDSGARVVFVENARQAEKLATIRERGIVMDGEQIAVPISHVIIFDGDADGCTSLSALRAQGRRQLESHRAEVERRISAINADDVATIVYTSGTTGLPKGVIQTHANHLAALGAVAAFGVARKGETDFSFLPYAHSFGRMMEYLGVFLGTVTAYAESIDTIIADLGSSRPHLMPAVPRIFEKFFAAVQQSRSSSGALSRAIFDWAVSVGRRRAQYSNRNEPIPVLLAALDRVAHQLVFDKIHARLGGRMRVMISGGAPLSQEINEFFHAVGLPIYEGYGLTETTPILTSNYPGCVRLGTVGRPVRDVTLKIAEDGEILAKGPNIAQGYFNRPDDTAEAWSRDGWFHTGDIGQIEDGFLRITDRKKELIKTAGGKYVAPQKIENLLKSRFLISQAVVVGDQRKFCVALISLDPASLAAWAERHGLHGANSARLRSEPRLLAAVQAEVDAVNAGLASFESIKYFRLVEREFTVEDGELTPSLKIKRRVIEKKHEATIASMYEAATRS